MPKGVVFSYLARECAQQLEVVARLQLAGSRQRCKPCDIDKHDLHVQTVILQLTQYLLCFLSCTKMWCEVAVKVRHPGVVQAIQRVWCR